MATRTYGPTKVEFYESYEVWLAVVRKKGLTIITLGGGNTAQDGNGTCRGFWARDMKKGWADK